MIKEDYVSFETAKLLKEKGFDSECDYLYVNGNIVRAQGYRCNWNKGETIFTNYKNECSAPTLQMAMKWLREVHDVIINIFYDGEEEAWCAEYYRMLIGDYVLIGHYKTYEQACETAIKWCLDSLV